MASTELMLSSGPKRAREPKRSSRRSTKCASTMRQRASDGRRTGRLDSTTCREAEQIAARQRIRYGEPELLQIVVPTQLHGVQQRQLRLVRTGGRLQSAFLFLWSSHSAVRWYWFYSNGRVNSARTQAGAKRGEGEARRQGNATSYAQGERGSNCLEMITSSFLSSGRWKRARK